jgi:hypothetical protein
VFGDDKYLMRMTLGEALADDLKAIEDGVFALLPKRDASGRQLVYVEPNRRTEGLYSSESLVGLHSIVLFACDWSFLLV